ncbi:MAG: hypothetical protein WB588_09120 [Dehalococcoidia bacterium]
MGENALEPRTDFLFANPSFCGGVARILDFGGTLTDYNASPSGEMADAIAIGMDVAVVGKDMKGVMAGLGDNCKNA